MAQPIRSVILLKDFWDVLESRGFSYLDEIPSNEALSQIFPNDKELCKAIKSFRKSPAPPRLPISAARNNLLTTRNEGLNKALGGGFLPGSVVEVFGPAGVGKTQLCMQLCCCVQLPLSAGGLNGKAIYLDTEASFFPQRFREIADATTSDRPDSEPHPFLDNVFIRKIYHFQELLATLDILLSDNGPQGVRLLVVDSIAYLFRFDEEEETFKRRTEKNAQLFKFLTFLNQFALKKNAVVLVTNQMTTKFYSDEGVDAPALGRNWDHSCTVKIRLGFSSEAKGIKTAQMIKCSYGKPSGRALYRITNNGIQDASFT